MDEEQPTTHEPPPALSYTHVSSWRRVLCGIAALATVAALAVGVTSMQQASKDVESVSAWGDTEVILDTPTPAPAPAHVSATGPSLFNETAAFHAQWRDCPYANKTFNRRHVEHVPTQPCRQPVCDTPGGIGMGPNALTFSVLGDWGAVHDVARLVAAALAAGVKNCNSTFIANVGDNFYMEGVKSERDKRFVKQFGRIWGGTQVPWYLILGNHDYHGKHRAQVKYHYLPHKDWRWNMPGYQWSRVFTTEGGMTVQIVGIDVQRMYNFRHRFGGQRVNPNTDDCFKWFNNVLKCSTADWLIVMGHNPLRSDGKRGVLPQLTKRLNGMLIKYGVNLYLSGHDHHMAHMVEPGSHLRSFILGNGCSADTVRRKSGYQVFAQAVPGFATIRVTPCELQAWFYDAWTGEPVHDMRLPNYRTQWLKRNRPDVVPGYASTPATQWGDVPKDVSGGGDGYGCPVVGKDELMDALNEGEPSPGAVEGPGDPPALQRKCNGTEETWAWSVLPQPTTGHWGP